MKLSPQSLPDDPVLLKQLLVEMGAQLERLQEDYALLRRKLFAPSSEKVSDADAPQLAMFNEAEETLAAPAAEPGNDEEVIAPVKRRGKRKPPPTHLPRIDIVHELPEHELTCECGCRKQVIGEETSEQLDIVPAKFQVIRHIRKTYACKACVAAPVTADKRAQLIEKSLASPSVLAMLLTTKYADGLPLYRFEKVLNRHGVEVSRQTLARWVIQCAAQFQPLLNLLSDRLLESPVIHCDETRLQVLHEPGRGPTAQSWMWVQAGGQPDTPIILFDYDPSRAQAVPLRLLEGYNGYLMTDDYAGYNAVAALPGITRLGCWAAGRMHGVSSSKRRKYSPRVKPAGPTWR